MAKSRVVTTKDGNDYVIGVFNGDHIFSENEEALFNIIDIDGDREEIEKKRSDDLGIKQAFKSKSTEWTLEMPEVKHLWTDNGVMREMKEKPKYLHSFKKGKFINNIKTNLMNMSEVKIAVPEE